MSTHVKKSGVRVGNPIQVFAHHDTHASLPDALALSAGDIIDVFNSLGSAASRVQFIMRGNIEIVVKFNDLQPATIYNPSGPDTTTYVSSSGVSAVRLLNSSGTQVFEFNDMGIRDITVVSVGSATTAHFIEIVVSI
jgi:hypothetical protein